MTDASPRTAVPAGAPGSPPQQQRSRRSHDQILLAALHLFGEQGFHLTTLAHIGARAGCSPALVTRHFGSKDGLLRALIERQRLLWHPEQLEALLDGDLPPGVMVALADDYALLLEIDAPLLRAVHGSLFEALRAEPGALHEEVVLLHRDHRARLAGAVRRGQAEGHVRAAVDPDSFAGLAVALMRGVAYQWLLDDSVDLATLVRAQARLMEEHLHGQ